MMYIIKYKTTSGMIFYMTGYYQTERTGWITK